MYTNHSVNWVLRTIISMTIIVGLATEEATASSDPGHEKSRNSANTPPSIRTHEEIIKDIENIMRWVTPVLSEEAKRKLLVAFGLPYKAGISSRELIEQIKKLIGPQNKVKPIDGPNVLGRESHKGLEDFYYHSVMDKAAKETLEDLFKRFLYEHSVPSQNDSKAMAEFLERYKNEIMKSLSEERLRRIMELERIPGSMEQTFFKKYLFKNPKENSYELGEDLIQILEQASRELQEQNNKNELLKEKAGELFKLALKAFKK